MATSSIRATSARTAHWSASATPPRTASSGAKRSRSSPPAAARVSGAVGAAEAYLALVIPPVAPAIDIVARSLAEIGRADDEDLEAVRAGLVASPGTGRDTDRVPFLQLDDLVVELHPPAPSQDHVHLLLPLVRVAVRKAIAGRDALVAQAGFLELERPGRHAELQVRRAVEPGPEVLQILLEVPESERHGRNPTVPWLGRRSDASSAAVPGSFPAARRGSASSYRFSCKAVAVSSPGRVRRLLKI